MLHIFFTKKRHHTLLFCIILSLILGVFLFIWIRSYTYQNTQVAEPPTTEIDNIYAPVISETQKIERSKQARIDKERANDQLLSWQAKQERALLLAKKADYLALNSEYHDALEIYERVLDLSSIDEYKKKAAAIAFKARVFHKTIQWYSEIPQDLSLQEKEDLLMSMRYVWDKNFLSMVEKMDIPPYIQKAYEVSWTCENTFIDCENAIRKYSFDYRPINNLKKALDDFKNLKNTDINYKEALLIGAFYQNKDYTTVIRIWSNLLSRKPDYKPILKIIGFSAYLTNQFERAENALKKYKTLEAKDPEVDFILGLIYFAKEDFKLSNLYFNNAVLWGYKPKSVVERKLAYNYGILWMTNNMFQVLNYLIEWPDATELDITNALYLALNEKKLELAEKWIKIGLEKSPNSHDIIALRGWYMRLTNNKEIWLALLKNILDKNPNHLIALVQSWIIYAEKWEKEMAHSLLERAALIDAGGIWADTIEKHLLESSSKDEKKNN